ncbi:hypothetical protein EUGRSUZ_L00233 [Eucalyptus grandis]|uniref:RING-type E3 ubiquitin transferase n=1 Tax=Eucalyptus grandis TaxID=71139 RepID=A0A058ZX22_EUCGR|nr:hypothetical protein EUGRSUZ_L00233 [Eucalyptus grandis]
MASQNSQLFHWRYTELHDHNFQIQGHTLFYVVGLFRVVCLVTLLFLYARWVCRYHGLPPETSHAPDAAAIDRLPIVLHGSVSSEAVEGSGECSMCLGAFEDGEKVKVLPRCGDRYHCACVDRWLVTRPVCLLCRAPLRVDPAGPWV